MIPIYLIIIIVAAAAWMGWFIRGTALKHEKDTSLPRSLDAIVVGDTLRSPAYEDDQAKDQDRAIWVSTDGGGVGCVCDGTSSSWYSAIAAETVTEFIRDREGPWDEAAYNVDLRFHDYIADIVKNLLDLRRKSQDEPIRLPEGRVFSEGERELLEETTRELQRSAYQTTMVIAELTLMDSPECGLRIRSFKVGDSEMFVFACDGELLDTTARLVPRQQEQSQLYISSALRPPRNRQMNFDHASQLTDVLPDSLASSRDSLSKVAITKTTIVKSTDVFVLLTSDGLIDAFDGPFELFTWFQKNEATLTSEDTLSSLHNLLKQRHGDDDISFVWIPPSSHSVHERRGR